VSTIADASPPVPTTSTSTSATTIAPDGSTTSASTSPTSTSTTSTSTTVEIDGDGPLAGRPFDVFVPTTYDGTSDVPLVVMLHGYTASGALQESYFGVQPLAEELGFLYVHPDGTADPRGNRFWNATDACCNLAGADVDDVAYLSALVAEVQRRYRVDPKRIFFVGHSNGGFMSYRMACERPDLIAAIASLAGATFAEAGVCHPSEPVSVLQVHGTADNVIPYDGGAIRDNAFPSAATSVGTWAGYDGCTGELASTGTTIDLDSSIDGEESSVEAFTACPDGVAVELWTIDGGTHIPELSSAFTRDVVEFLLDHPKP